MPTFFTMPEPAAFEVREILRQSAAPVAFGDDGLSVAKQMNDVLHHWREQSATYKDEPEDLFAYNPVPFQSAGIRKVRYTRIVPLPPRHIDFDEELE